MEAHALKVVLGMLFLEDPGSKNRTWNWTLAGQAVSNCKYDFCKRVFTSQESRTRSWEMAVSYKHTG